MITKSGHRSTLSYCYEHLAEEEVIQEWEKRKLTKQRWKHFLLPLMEEHGFELVDVEYVKEAGTWYLRAYIDKEGGIAVDDVRGNQPQTGRLAG